MNKRTTQTARMYLVKIGRAVSVPIEGSAVNSDTRWHESSVPSSKVIQNLKMI